ncbi:MAG: hypothetical protein QW728_00465, partial [Thermoplasmata archaeon]
SGAQNNNNRPQLFSAIFAGLLFGAMLNLLWSGRALSPFVFTTAIFAVIAEGLFSKEYFKPFSCILFSLLLFSLGASIIFTPLSSTIIVILLPAGAGWLARNLVSGLSRGFVIAPSLEGIVFCIYKGLRWTAAFADSRSWRIFRPFTFSRRTAQFTTLLLIIFFYLLQSVIKLLPDVLFN